MLPNLKLQPRAFMLQDGLVSARVVPEAPDQFSVHARIAGDGNALLEIPIWLSSNVKSFVVVATMDDYISGTVQMTGGNEKIRVLSSPQPLLSSSTFALGLPGTGQRSASGTLDGTIQIALAGLPKSETQEVRIRLSISQRNTR
ncbi:MAG: hypothetical protein L0Z53_13495 [Acidobacteriales bacterium]|nr:hypothetical protein [Terriglobales bacterium]